MTKTLRLPDELKEIIVRIFVPFYLSAKKNGGDEYFPASTYMGLPLLFDLYEKSIEAKDIEPIENLSVELKQKYWNQAKKYFTEDPDRNKSARACYMLDEVGRG